MKGVHCSWVDMLKLREALSAGERGDQKRLEQMRCVDDSTVAKWKVACDLIGVIEAKTAISQFSHFQPSHAVEIARHVRRTDGRDPAKWSEETRERIVEWVERVESEELTVQQLRSLLRSPQPAEPAFSDGCTAAA